MRTPIPIGFLLVVLAVCAPATAMASGALRVGDPAPALAVKTFDDKPFDLADLRGKVVIVNFWATWCPPCRAEMPTLDAFFRREQDHGVVLLGLSQDKPRARAEARRVMEKFSYPGALAFDAKSNGFGAQNALPMTYVIDAAGKVRAVLPGDMAPMTDKLLSDIVNPLE